MQEIREATAARLSSGDPAWRRSASLNESRAAVAPPQPLAQFARERFLGKKRSRSALGEENCASISSRQFCSSLDASLQIAHVGHDQLRRRARRRRAQVGDEIGNGEIDFVADRANDRNRRMKNRAGDDLFVELPQILDASAAARDDDQIERRPGLVRLAQFANGDRRFPWPRPRPARARD